MWIMDGRPNRHSIFNFSFKDVCFDYIILIFVEYDYPQYDLL